VVSTVRRSDALRIGDGPQGPMSHNARIDWARTARRAVMEALRVYAVTDSAMIAARNKSVEEAVEEAVRGGATIIQLRCAFSYVWQ
jgi:hypothetical protein